MNLRILLQFLFNFHVYLSFCDQHRMLYERLINFCQTQLLILKLQKILFFGQHFSFNLAVELRTKCFWRPTVIFLHYQSSSEFSLELRWMAILKETCQNLSISKNHLSFCILLQKLLSDRPQETASSRWPYNVSHIHSRSESGLQERNRTLHWTHHGHYTFVSYIDDCVPHLHLAGNEHVSDDEFEKVDLAGVNFLFWKIEFDHLFDIQNQNGTVLGVSACQVINTCFLGQEIKYHVFLDIFGQVEFLVFVQVLNVLFHVLYGLLIVVICGLQPSQSPASVPPCIDSNVLSLKVLLKFFQFGILILCIFGIAFKYQSLDLVVFGFYDVVIRLQTLCGLVIYIGVFGSRLVQESL